jgi:trimeric autotransporter adhesin
VAVAVQATATEAVSLTTAVTTLTNSSLTVSSGATALLAILVFDCFSAVPSGVAVKWDNAGTPQTMTLLATINSAATNVLVQLYGLVSPTTGNKNLTATWTNGCQAILTALSFTGTSTASVAAAFANAGTNTGTSGSPTVTLTSAVNNISVCVSETTHTNTSLTATGSTNIFLRGFNAAVGSFGGIASRAPGASSVVWTVAPTATEWAIAGVDVVASSGTSAAATEAASATDAQTATVVTSAAVTEAATATDTLIAASSPWNVHVGLAAWSNHTFTVGEDCSNAGNAYRCITAGTSTAAPTGTGANIAPGGVAHFKWLSAIDYTSLQAVADAQWNSLIVDSEVWIWNHGVIPCVAGTTLFYWPAPTTPHTLKLKIRPAPGEGLYEKSGIPLAWDPTNGVAIQLPAGADSAINYLYVEASNVTFEGIQFQNPRQGGTATPLMMVGANPTIRKCLFDVYGRSSVKNVELAAPGVLVDTCLFLDRHSTAPQNLLGVTTGASKIINSLFVATAAAGVGQAVYVEDTVAAGRVIRNSAIFGWATAEPIWSGAANIITADHCITDRTSNLGDITVDGGNNLLGKVLSNQVRSTSDFRLKTGADCIGAGVVDTDSPQGFFGNLRGTAADIGPDEVAAGAATEAVTATTAQTAAQIAAASATEAASASDLPNGIAIRVVAASEPASATDTPAASVVTAAAGTDAATAADAPSAATTAVAAITETASSADAQTATASLVSANSEAAAATTAQTATAALPAGATEAATAADAPATSAILAAAATETAAAADAPATGNVTSAAATETATSTDAPSAAASLFSTATEAAAAADAPTATSVRLAPAGEAATATDAATAAIATAASLAEGTNSFDLPDATITPANVAATFETVFATDVPAANVISSATATELASGIDAPGAGTVTTAARLDAATATDLPTATVTWPAAITEAATATDAASAGSTSAGTSATTETVAATDAPSAATILPAGTVEAAGAGDQSIADRTAFAGVTEAASATDSPSAQRAQFAAVTEAASAADTRDAAAAAVAQVTEAAAATDVVPPGTVTGAAAVIETAPAADLPATTGITSASVAEAAFASDVPVVQRIMFAAITEAAAASDAPAIGVISVAAATTETTLATDSASASAIVYAGAIELAHATDAGSASLAGSAEIGTWSSFRAPLVIHRETPGSYVAGVWQPGGEASVTIMANVQPATIFDYDRMQAEHGGQRLERMIRIYTGSELLVSDPAGVSGSTEQAGDIVLYDPPLARAPGRYRVIGQAIWAGGMSVDHYRYLAALEPPA